MAASKLLEFGALGVRFFRISRNSNLKRKSFFFGLSFSELIIIIMGKFYFHTFFG